MFQKYLLLGLLSLPPAEQRKQADEAIINFCNDFKKIY